MLLSSIAYTISPSSPALAFAASVFDGSLPLPANMTAAGLIVAAAIIMFRRVLSAQDELKKENLQIRSDQREIESRCEEKIHLAVQEAIAHERARAAASEARLRSDLIRLRKGLRNLAERLTDPQAMHEVIELLAGGSIDDNT